MRSHGFAFCDDQEHRIKEIVEDYQPVREAWDLDSNRYQSLIVEAVEASSTDDPAQSIGMDNCYSWELREHRQGQEQIKK